MHESQESDAVIAIVDDDPSVRRGLERLIRSVGWKAEQRGLAAPPFTRANRLQLLQPARISIPILLSHTDSAPVDGEPQRGRGQASLFGSVTKPDCDARST
jgi:hypothetical protein